MPPRPFASNHTPTQHFCKASCKTNHSFRRASTSQSVSRSNDPISRHNDLWLHQHNYCAVSQRRPSIGNPSHNITTTHSSHRPVLEPDDDLAAGSMPEPGLSLCSSPLAASDVTQYSPLTIFNRPE